LTKTSRSTENSYNQAIYNYATVIIRANFFLSACCCLSTQKILMIVSSFFVLLKGREKRRKKEAIKRIKRKCRIRDAREMQIVEKKKITNDNVQFSKNHIHFIFVHIFQSLGSIV